MVETRFNEADGSAVIVLRPNNSASWQVNLAVIGLVTLVLFAVCVYFALKGLWLVFPFAGLEVVALYICFYLRVRANNRTEVITFDRDTVVIEQGKLFAEKSWKYHRLWAKIFVRKAPYIGHPKQVIIRSHGKELELGAFLNNQDKEVLIKDLKNIIYA